MAVTPTTRGTDRGVAGLLDEEALRGMRGLEVYDDFQDRADGVKNAFLPSSSIRKDTEENWRLWRSGKGKYTAELCRS